MDDNQFVNEELLESLINSDEFIYHGINLAKLASQSFNSQLGEEINSDKKCGLPLLLFKAVARAIFVPPTQMVIAKALQTFGKIKIKKESDIVFFSFARSHTEILQPIIMKLAERKKDTFQFLRASIGFPDFIKELDDYSHTTNDKPGLLELFYDPITILQYYLCVFSMLKKVVIFIWKDNTSVSKQIIENIQIRNAIPSFLIYFASMSFLVIKIGQKHFYSKKAFIFGYDNCPRGRALISIASINRIKTLSIQHGLIAIPRYYLPYAEKMVVWNEKEYTKLISVGANPSKLLVWGSPLFERISKISVDGIQNRNQIVFALTKGISSPQLSKDVDLILDALQADPDNGLQLIIRPHPLDKRRINKILSSKINRKLLVIENGGDFDQVIQNCCLGIIYYSSVVLNFLMKDIPVVSILDSEQTDPTGIVDGKIVKCITSSQELSTLISKILRHEEDFFVEFEKKREVFLQSYFLENEIPVFERIISFLDGLV